MKADDPNHDSRPESWLQRQFSRMEEAVGDWGFAVVDTLEARCFRGIIVPLAVGALGVYYLVVQKVGLWGSRPYRLVGEGPRMILTGWGAVALGLALVCFGLCLHFHFFWRVKQPRVGAVGMFISLVLTGLFFIGFIVALVQCA